MQSPLSPPRTVVGSIVCWFDGAGEDASIFFMEYDLFAVTFYPVLCWPNCSGRELCTLVVETTFQDGAQLPILWFSSIEGRGGGLPAAEFLPWSLLLVLASISEKGNRLTLQRAVRRSFHDPSAEFGAPDVFFFMLFYFISNPPNSAFHLPALLLRPQIGGLKGRTDRPRDNLMAA